MDKIMQVVINIPEDVYRRLKAGDTNAGNTFHNTALESIGNGVVLPDEHGDLIDRKELLSHTKCTYKYDCQNGSSCDRCSDNCIEVRDVENATTIIPAD